MMATNHHRTAGAIFEIISNQYCGVARYLIITASWHSIGLEASIFCARLLTLFPFFFQIRSIVLFFIYIFEKLNLSLRIQGPSVYKRGRLWLRRTSQTLIFRDERRQSPDNFLIRTYLLLPFFFPFEDLLRFRVTVTAHERLLDNVRTSIKAHRYCHKINKEIYNAMINT